MWVNECVPSIWITRIILVGYCGPDATSTHHKSLCQWARTSTNSNVLSSSSSSSSPSSLNKQNWEMETRPNHRMNNKNAKENFNDDCESISLRDVAFLIHSSIVVIIIIVNRPSLRAPTLFFARNHFTSHLLAFHSFEAWTRMQIKRCEFEQEKKREKKITRKLAANGQTKWFLCFKIDSIANSITFNWSPSATIAR